MWRTILWALPMAGIIACNGGDPDQSEASHTDTECGASESEGSATQASSTTVDPSAESSTGDDTIDPGSSSEGESSTDPDPGTTESGTESGARCGDGTCDADEDEASCCDDCGCAEGSSCVDAVCTPDPFCGDKACNGDETMEDCCDDCGCAEGSECQEGACVVLPVCGDGMCNGEETIDDCCDDCGCGDNYTCEANACVCAEAHVRFENVMPDVEQFCFATNSWYTQQSTAYVNAANMGWVYLSDGSWIDVVGDVGTEIGYTSQCCLLDPCGGNQTCPTPNGNYPCFCADPVQSSVDVAVCGENDQPVCG